jgi:hypothetical protein
MSVATTPAAPVAASKTSRVVLERVDGLWKLVEMTPIKLDEQPIGFRDIALMERVLRREIRVALSKFRLNQHRQRDSKPEGVTRG